MTDEYAATGFTIQYEQLSEATLQTLYGKGDLQALKHLFALHKEEFTKRAEKLCRYYCYRETHDAVSDLYVRLASEKAYQLYDPTRPFIPWAMRILTNIARHYSRQEPHCYWVLCGKWKQELVEEGNVAVSICAKLEPLNNRRFFNEGEFRIAVETLLSGPEFATAWTWIVKRAKHGTSQQRLAEKTSAQLVARRRFQPEEIAQLVEAQQHLIHCMAELSSEEQFLLRARYIENNKLREIAEVLDVSVTTVYRRLRNAKVRLQRLLEQSEHVLGKVSRR